MTAKLLGGMICVVGLSACLRVGTATGSGPTACRAAEVGGFCNLGGGVSWLCCAGTGCTDTSVDSKNCGGCGVSCPAGASCEAGVCG